MELSPAERVAVLSVLPRTGAFAGLALAERVGTMLALTDEERQQYVRRVNGTVAVAHGAGQREFPLGPPEQALIAGALERLSAAEKLTAAHLGIYRRFVDAAEGA